MTKIKDVFAYLNQFDPSKIRPVVEPVVAEMKNEALTDVQLDAKIREGMEKSRYPFIPLEYAEIKLHSALAKYAHKKYYESKILLDEALPVYEHDPHRKVVTLWMMGFNSLALEDMPFAYSYWLSARMVLEEIMSGNKFPLVKPEKIAWYKDRLKDLNFIMAENCIQEIYNWFGMHETSHLDGQTKDFSKKIIEAIGYRKTHEAHQLIDSLIRLTEMSNDHELMREVYVICGMGKYLLGSTVESIKYFSEATGKLEPRSQRQAVAFWLKGTAQWRNPNQREDALTNLNRAVDLFKELKLKADKKHLTQVMQWYDEKLAYMEKELAQKEKVLLTI